MKKIFLKKKIEFSGAVRLSKMKEAEKVWRDDLPIRIRNVLSHEAIVSDYQKLHNSLIFSRGIRFSKNEKKELQKFWRRLFPAVFVSGRASIT